MKLSQKFLTGQVPMNMQKNRKAKLESAYSSMVKYSKITVCSSETFFKVPICARGDSHWVGKVYEQAHQVVKAGEQRNL